MVGELINLISGIALHSEGGKARDLLGRVYEYFLGGFAGSEGKRGGQFYTPRSVVKVLVDMLEPFPDPARGVEGRVYDPCCGSGGMFVQAERFLEAHGGRIGQLAIYGQESNYTTWRLAKMNLAVRGIDASGIAWNNEGSFHKDEWREKKFKLRPEWHNDDDEQGALKVVMTGVASDPVSWQGHIGRRAKARRELLAKRAKKSDDPLKLVIVRNMWLTGFDAPSMHTMYVDKPMKGHGLMQAIARVNRVFRDKPSGLLVDYIGVAQSLKAALGQYSSADRDETGIDEEEAIAAMLEKYKTVNEMFRPGAVDGFDYRLALEQSATPQLRLTIMAGAMDWVLSTQQELAAQKKKEEDKKRAHRHYADAVLALSKLYAMSAASDAARKIRDEVGFFQAVRVALFKTTAVGGRSAADRELAIQQIISRAVVSTDIVDIMAALGLSRPDISILSDEFLGEVRELDKNNLAVEALRKLLAGQVHSQGKRNITQARAFSERLDAAIARYHTNAVTTVEVLEELIKLAHEIRSARARGEESGLNEDEVAFYDALAVNQSARDVIGEPALRIIAHELVQSIRSNVTVEWANRESARARLRALVKRILRKYGYPPDLQDAAVQVVLQQAEAMSAGLATSG
jgi:type I restriction enzyme R subunit